MKKVTSEISGTVFSLPWIVAKAGGMINADKRKYLHYPSGPYYTKLLADPALP